MPIITAHDLNISDMKHIKTICLLGLACLWSSCEKTLELQPVGSLATEEALSDVPALRTALFGLYHTLQAPAYYGKEFPWISELGGNLVYLRLKKPNPLFTQYYSYTITPLNGPAQVWNACYKTILKANNIINHIDGIEGDATEKNQIKGEALALRALAYFDLVRSFAKPYATGDPLTDPGVPIVLTAGIYEPPRNTVAEVYDRIAGDLETAKPLMKKISPYRFSPDAADALLARVNLYKGDWARAEQLAGAVIENGAYALADNVTALFAGPGSTEEIFTLKFEDSESTGAGNFGHQYNLSGQGDTGVSDDLIALYEPGDTRRSLIFTHTDGENYQTKFLAQNGIAGLHSPKLLRLAELYLIRAEARYRRNDTASALADLDSLRIKRGASAWISLPNGIADILHERQRELAFEGHTTFDYWRTGTTMTRTMCNTPLQYGAGPCQMEAADYRTVYPIPQTEKDANRSITQNTGYQ